MTFGSVPVVNVALTRLKGGKVKIIGMVVNNTIAGFASLAESGIKVPKDIEGRSLATTVGSTAVQYLPIFAKINSVNLKKVKIVYMDGSVMVQALLKKEVELATLHKTALWEVFLSVARKQGKAVSFLDFADYGVEIYSSAIATSEKVLNENPDLVKRFLRATYKGFAYSINHPDEAINILSKYHPEIEKEIARMQLDSTLDLLQSKEAKEKGLGWISEEKMRKTIDMASQAHGEQFKFPLEDIYTNKFLPGKF